MTKKKEVSKPNAQWWLERNARRRKRYATDPDYREQQVEKTRGQYRKGRELVVRTSCLDNLSTIMHFGETRTVTVDEKEQRRITFTTEELANALNRNVEVIYRWFRKGMFPDPVVKLVDVDNQHGYVYTLTQTQKLVEVMGNHQGRTPYYRQDHTDTRAALFEAMDAAGEN